MTALWIVVVKIPTLNMESVSSSIGPQQLPRAQVLSLFTELLAERTEGLFKVYIQNRFNNNITIYTVKTNVSF